MEKKNIDQLRSVSAEANRDYRFVANYKDGAWDEGELTTDAKITISECAGVLQYAQTCFEGMKAYTTEDGHIVVFRPTCNASRMADLCRRLEMSGLEDKFVEAIDSAVAANEASVPPSVLVLHYISVPYMFGSDPGSV